MPRFAANLSFLFTELPFIDRFAAAARAGFDAVEFAFPPNDKAKDIADAASAANVEIVLFNAPPGGRAGDFGLAAVAGREGEFRAAIELAFDYARIFKCPRIHVMAGLADARSSAACAVYRANLAAASEAAADNVQILIEPINPRSVPGYFLNSFAAANRFLDELARENIALLFDIFHRQVLHGDVSYALESMISRIGHIQVAAAPERHEPGTGELAEDRLWQLLDRLGYAGAIGAEYRPSDTTESGLAWFKPYRRQ